MSDWGGIAVVAAVGVLVASCSQSLSVPGDDAGTGTGTGGGTGGGTVRVVLVGDVMLGRHVAAVVANDPDSVFERLRPVLVAADLALANLESPLTERPHVVGPHALEADPSAAGLLAGAGFDAVAIANNHAGDAGPATVTDTMAALTTAGLGVIGGGVDARAAVEPYVFEHDGVRVAALAFDLTGGGPVAGDGPGVAAWDAAAVRTAVAEARSGADVVIVGVHGGVELLPRPDPVLRGIADQLTDWGADVVWGTGAHVAYPVVLAEGVDGRPSVQAPGLGNALFDQGIDVTEVGGVLEVVVDRDGVVAYRRGSVDGALRSSFAGWDEPTGDAVTLWGQWWSPARTVPVEPATATAVVPGLAGDAVLVGAAPGDLTGDGIDEVVASYRTPFGPRPLHAAYPGVDFADAAGRGAHLGVFRVEDGTLLWGAGTMVQPVARLAVCDGSVALGFSTLDDAAVSSGGAWFWKGFGFGTAPVLAGASTPACADVDGDGRSEPVLVGRTTKAGA